MKSSQKSLQSLTCVIGSFLSVKGGKVRGVNLGNCLVVERWMKPELFDGISNPDMLFIMQDGAKVRFRSLKLNKYISAKNGGGSGVFVDQEKAIDWETFRDGVVLGTGTRATEGFIELLRIQKQSQTWSAPSLTYTIYPHGSTDSLPYVTMGSGSLAVMAMFASQYREGMTGSCHTIWFLHFLIAGIFVPWEAARRSMVIMVTVRQFRYTKLRFGAAPANPLLNATWVDYTRKNDVVHLLWLYGGATTVTTNSCTAATSASLAVATSAFFTIDTFVEPNQLPEA
ncbi:hypothetical protein C5167_018994, partial [Papaver somniferum]